ncbi:putative nuclease HARBI1 [Schistocerca gregaria]|uniref:putative nuclease HARBI1 n=1 Tax=Schistocerca gregaria TaxID=7010 RepID=UPI00211EC0E8|nr:putative nuclease HARBI1 [Schistocerca gregaria]
MNTLLMTLREYTTGALNIVIGDSANVHSTTALRIISEVSGIIPTMSCQYIKFPSQLEVRSVMDGFHHNLIIWDIVAWWPGSVHGSTIFHNCARWAQSENGEIPVSHLLADSGYACKPYLLPPLSNPQSLADHQYNRSDVTTRKTVERQYGLWKKRFPILSMGMRCNPQKTMAFIVSTAVLHNIARSTSKEEPPEGIGIMWLLRLLCSERGLNIDNNEPMPPCQQMYHDDTLLGRADHRTIIDEHFY